MSAARAGFAICWLFSFVILYIATTRAARPSISCSWRPGVGELVVAPPPVPADASLDDTPIDSLDMKARSVAARAADAADIADAGWNETDLSRPCVPFPGAEPVENCCVSAEQLRQGAITGHGAEVRWVPAEGCVLPHYGQRGAAACYRQHKIVIIGDSLLKYVFHHEGLRNPELIELVSYSVRHRHVRKGVRGSPPVVGRDLAVLHELDPRLVRVYRAKNATDHSQLVHFRSRAMGWQHFESHPLGTDDRKSVYRKFLDTTLAEADVVMAHAALWDLGASFCGPAEFYCGVKRVLAEMRSRTKPGARLLLWNLHWLHTNSRCKASSLCATCNDHRKVAVYREALELAAGCVEGIELVDTKNITRNAGSSRYSKDGIHYGRDASSLEHDLFFSHFCMQPAVSSVLPRECSSAIEAEALKRWQTVPEAWQGCSATVPIESICNETVSRDACPAGYTGQL